MTGFLCVDKPTGRSSAFIVNVLKRMTGTPCGHMGTLDPFASGVLPVGVGNATRLFDFFLSKKKSYRATFRFGVTTDTLDPEGEISFGGTVPTEEEIRSVLPAFVGEIEQIPPIYSAKSIDGKRSYELARRGEEVALTPKKVTVEAFELLRRTGEDSFEFCITCGAGTYIRALARDLAKALGTLGYCTALRRTQSGFFTEGNAVPFEEITPETWKNYLIPTDAAIDLPAIDITDARLYNGIALETELSDGLYKLYNAGEFYGLARAAGGRLKTEKKLC